MAVSVQVATSRPVDRSMFLRRVLQADAIFLALSGLACIVEAAPIATMLGINALFVWPVGVVLLLFAALVWVMMARPTIRMREAIVLTALGAVWVLASAVALFSGAIPTSEGWWFVLIQGLIVATFMDLEIVGLWRMRQAGNE